MRPGVFRQVNQFHGLARAQQRGFRHGVRLARQRDYRAVVIRVHLAIQHVHARHAAHCRDNGVDLGGVASFRKIGHALNQSFHFFGFLSCLPAQLFGSFGLRSGNVGRSYTKALFPGLPGVPGAPEVCPAGAGGCAGFIDSRAGTGGLCSRGLATAGGVFGGHCGPIIGFMFGGSAFFINCGAAGISCLDFSIVLVTACCFR